MCDVFDDYGIAQLKEVLQMCTCVLAWQTTELDCLHHHNQASLELEVSSGCVDSGPNGHVGNNRDGVLVQRLVGHGVWYR